MAMEKDCLDFMYEMEITTKMKEKMQNLLLYGGISKEEYQACKPAIHKSNKDHVIIYSSIGIITFTIALILSFFFTSISSNRVAYVVEMSLMLILLLANILVKEIKPRIINVTVYLFTISLYLAGIYISAVEGVNDIAGTFIALLLVTPLLFIVKPIHSTVLIILTDILFVGMLHVMHQERDLLNDNTVKAIIFGFLSVVVSSTMTIVKIDRYDAEAKNREILKLLEEKNEQAQSATKSKSIFLSNMSHEIRTPINSILGMNELILRESKEKNVLEKAGIIKSSSEILLSIVNEILDFSKIESGKMELVITEYDLRSLINDIYNIFCMKMSDRKLKFIIDVDEKLPAVLLGDSIRLRQVIINLMTNALKYTDDGSVTFHIFSSKSEKKDCIKLNVEVIDTGTGIAKEDLAKLNESFVRLNLSRNHSVEGTGLGINIVNGFLNLMDSHLMVESQINEGSKFYFSVEQEIVNDEPIGHYDPSEVSVIQAENVRTTPKYMAPDAKLLVVDDNEANIQVFTGLLAYMKMNIDTALSGESAIKLCDENKYDIIFMDHMMPGMDGKETFHRIREQSELNKDTPVYILTANAISGAREEYLKEGFSGYISKPIIPVKLENAIFDKLDSSLLIAVDEPDIVPGTNEGEFNWDVSDLPQIEGVDWEYAKLHFGKKELLIDVLKTFVSGIPSSIKQILNHYERLKENCEDSCIDDYRILVHSNKSSSNMCGVIPLAGMAATLEYAARDRRVDTVLDMTPHYLSECEKYYTKLNEAFDFSMASGDKAIDLKEVKQILTELIEVSKAFDVDGMDACMEKLTKYQFEGELKEAVMNLGQLVTNLETESMLKAIDEILERM